MLFRGTQLVSRPATESTRACTARTCHPCCVHRHNELMKVFRWNIERSCRHKRRALRPTRSRCWWSFNRRSPHRRRRRLIQRLLQSGRIAPIDGVTAGIRVEVCRVVVAHGIGREEAARRGVVPSIADVDHPRRWIAEWQCLEPRSKHLVKDVVAASTRRRGGQAQGIDLVELPRVGCAATQVGHK